jgi:signal transduction histidine kinase
MVNDLSTLSRAERGVGDAAEDIDVAELVHGLYNEYQPQAEAKDLALDLHMPHTVGSVHASPLYLKELLQNFITNAIKYTREGSVTIDVKVRKDSVLFTVTDTGIGISKADQKRIFDKFYRAEDYRTRETSGTGLGLYVAVKLAKKLGTKISMKSRLNHGSAFSVALPIEK